MAKEVAGGYILGETLSKTTLGTIVKALPVEGEPLLVLAHRVAPEVGTTPEAVDLMDRQVKQWLKVRDLHTSNLVASVKEGQERLLVSEYHPGRVLSDVLEKARHEGIPLAADQAVYLAERLAGGLSSLAGQGIVCGCLSPERALVTFEGEIKILPCVFKDLQTTPLLSSPALETYLRYLPARAAEGKVATALGDVYALGALFFEFLCREPFHTGEAEFDAARRLEQGRAGLGLSDPLPEALFTILKKSLLQEAPEAYTGLEVMKADLDHLITSGEYSPTTFNMAFLMHSLFRGENESEDRANEEFAAMDRAPFRKAAPPPPPPPPPKPAEVPPAPQEPVRPGPFESTDTFPAPKKAGPPRGLLIGAGIAAAVLLAAVGLFLAFRGPKGPSPEEIKAQQELAALQAERDKSKAMQEEMAKKLKAIEDERNALQEQVDKAKTADEKARAQRALEDTQKRLASQQEEQARLAETASKAPPAAKPPSTAPPTAPAKTDQAASKDTGVQPPPSAESPSVPPPSPSPAPAAPAAETGPKTKAGDFVELWAVDAKPKQLNGIKIEATSAARQNRLKGTFYLEADVDETGTVTDARVVKGPAPDFGMNAACVAAAKGVRYSPALKDGVPVKTRLTFPIVVK